MLYTWFVCMWWRWRQKSSWGKIGDIELEPWIRWLGSCTLFVCTWQMLHTCFVRMWWKRWWKFSWREVGNIECKPRIRWLELCTLLYTWFVRMWWRRWWKFSWRKTRNIEFGSKLLDLAATFAGKDGTFDRLLQWNFNTLLSWWLIATNYWSKRHLFGRDGDSMLDALLWRKDENKMSY